MKDHTDKDIIEAVRKWPDGTNEQKSSFLNSLGLPGIKKTTMVIEMNCTDNCLSERDWKVVFEDALQKSDWTKFTGKEVRVSGLRHE